VCTRNNTHTYTANVDVGNELSQNQSPASLSVLPREVCSALRRYIVYFYICLYVYVRECKLGNLICIVRESSYLSGKKRTCRNIAHTQSSDIIACMRENLARARARAHKGICADARAHIHAQLRCNDAHIKHVHVLVRTHTAVRSEKEIRGIESSSRGACQSPHPSVKSDSPTSPGSPPPFRGSLSGSEQRFLCQRS